MPVTVKENIIRGSGLRVTAEGVGMSRVFEVYGLDKTPENDIHYRAYLAINTLAGQALGGFDAGVPGMIATSLSFDPRMNATDSVVATIGYQSTYLNISFDGVTMQESTKLDRAMKPIAVWYDPALAAGDPMPLNQPANGVLPETANVSILRPGAVLVFERIQLTNPYLHVRNFLGRMNSDDFQGAHPRQWLCTSITGRSSVVFGTIAYWVARYSFEFRGPLDEQNAATRQTWNPIVVWQDPKVRHSHVNIDPSIGLGAGRDDGNGWLRPNIYPEAPFNEMNFPVVKDLVAGSFFVANLA